MVDTRTVPKDGLDGRGYGLIAAGVALHLLLAFAFHLSPDETHYALYSVHPDWSYFDHPPMAGWLQWPFGAAASALGRVGIGPNLLMRLLPMACWVISAVWMANLAARLYPGVTSVRRVALVLWLLAPVPHLLGLALVPDSILMPVLCAVMALCWRLCHRAELPNVRLWLALGVALGLAGLSKYTAIFIGLGAVLVLFLAHGMSVLKERGAWLAVGLAALLITPVIGWNAANDWISLAYQANHAKGNAAWEVRHVAVFAVVQVLGYGLLLLVGIASGFKKAVPEAKANEPTAIEPQASALSATGFCLCFGLPPLLAMLYLSGRGSSLPHWSVTAWLALLPLAAAGCARLLRPLPGVTATSDLPMAPVPRGRRVVNGLMLFQGLCCVGLFGLMLSGGTQREQGHEATSLPGQVPATARFNPFADLYGWDDAALRARALAAQQANTSVAKVKPPTLAVMNWTLNSRIAWYANQPTRVVQRHLDQFGLWWGVLQPGDDALVVDWSQMSFAPPVTQAGGLPQFETCELLEQLPVLRWGRQIAHFNLQLCRNWQGPKETVHDRIRD